MIELYAHETTRVPDYAAMDPLELHLAFASQDPDGDRDALVHAGATAVSDGRLPDGSRLLMLRDPWGLAVQLCARHTALLVRRPRASRAARSGSAASRAGETGTLRYNRGSISPTGGASGWCPRVGWEARG